MARSFRSTFVILTSLALVSCSGESPVVQREKSLLTGSTDTLVVSWLDLQSDSMQMGTVFTVPAYVGDIGEYVTYTGQKMTVPFFERRNQRAGFTLHLNMQIGSEPNQVHQLPAAFLPEDFKLVCADGTIVTRGDCVQITARLQRPAAAGVIAADAIKIEKIKSPFDTTVFSQAIALTGSMLLDTTLRSIYCHLDGKIQIPEVIFSYTNEITLDLKGSSVEALKTIDIPLGAGPGTMDDLPDNYTENDLIIRDMDGKAVPYGKPVRLYGTWARNNFESSFPGKFYLEEVKVLN